MSEIALTSNSQILLDDPRMVIQGWRYYYVHSLQPLLQGDKRKISVIQRFFDEEGAFEAHLSKHVREPMDELFLRVIFPEGRIPAEEDFSAVERKGLRDGKVVKWLDFEYDATTRVVSLKVSKPRRKFSYSIEWTWDYPGATG